MTKQARGEDAMERLLDAALECVVEHGIHEVTIQHLSARAEMSVGSIYHHFGDRSGVIFALYRRCLERMLEAIAGSVLGRRSARAGVRALVEAYLRWVERHPDEARVIYAIAETELLETRRADLAALGARVTAPLAAWFAPHVAAGSVIDLQPGLLEVVLIGPAAEASRRILGGASGYSFDDAIAVLPDAVWRAVGQT
ncbi:MAG: TetR/AcrR family transcriptional regulator [Kofleriaceae bacterium]|nr:TetR/AcrR family transcriptional regulator [Kofleriaceae bacterium]